MGCKAYSLCSMNAHLKSITRTLRRLSSGSDSYRSVHRTNQQNRYRSHNMSVGSFGGSLPSVSLPSPVASGFTAPSDNPCEVITLVEQIDLRKAADRMAIAGANSFAAENFGSDRSFVPTSDASSARTSNRSFESLSIHTSSTGSTGRTSINSLPDAIQRPKTRPAAHVTADIRKFKEKDEKFFDDNWDNCFAAVKHKCLETDPIGYPRQLAYEELLRRWQSNRLATSRSTLPSQDAAGPVVDDASAPVMVKRGRLRAGSVAICSSGHPDISSVSNRGPSSLWSSRSNTPGSLPSIVESPEQESQEEDTYHDGGVVANRAPLAQRGSGKSMWRKRTTERDPSLGEISPCPSSKTDRFECDVPRSAEQSSADDETRHVQDESIKTGNHLDLQRVSPGPKIKRLAFIHREPHLSDGQRTKPHSELASLNLEAPDGTDPPPFHCISAILLLLEQQRLHAKHQSPHPLRSTVSISIYRVLQKRQTVAIRSLISSSISISYPIWRLLSKRYKAPPSPKPPPQPKSKRRRPTWKR